MQVRFRTTDDYRAALLRATHLDMLVLSAGFAAGIFAFMPGNRARGLALFASVSVTCLISRLLLKAGRLNAAGLVFLALLGVVVTLLAWTGGGERGVAVSGYMCIVLTAGLLFGLKGGLLASLSCLAAQAVLAYMTSVGRLPSSPHHTYASLLVAQAVFSLWVAILVFHYTRVISSVNHDLGERVKELTALHEASEAFQRSSLDMRRTLADLANLLPAAYQFPKAAAARVRLGGDEASTPDFEAGAPRQTAEFETSDGTRGTIEVAYVRDIPLKKGRFPFLSEEQALINTLADMLRGAYERAAADAALRESETHLRELFETARDTIYQLSTEGVILSLNPAFEKITGWKREEWIGKPFTGLVHSDDLIKTLDYYQNTLAGRETPLYEIRIRTRDEGYVNSEILAVPRIQNGATVGVLGIARDVTERRRLEDQIQRTQRVQSIGALASGIAHDLNNVLTPITLSGGLLERHMENNDRARKMLALILSAAHRGGEIVRQILTFARGDAGRAAPQDLRPLAREMETFMRETFPRNIDIRFDIPRELPPVLGDPTQIHQVLLNLCVNARDAMPEGGRLGVSAHPETTAPTDVEAPNEPGAGGYVVLTVADTGTGIPPEIQSRIFDPFFTTKRLGEGTGLGLSTTQSIVRAHGGFIRLNSSAANGTEFRIYWPAAKTAGAETDARPAPFPKGNGKFVLVVDDEKSILFFIREILELHGYSVRTAGNGVEALALYTAAGPGSISLVISDIDMPVMNGIDFLRGLRRIAPSVPLLLMSGSVSAWEPEPQEAEITRFLEKPFTTADLLKCIGTLRIA